MITRKELDQIFEETESKWDGDNALQGLMILRKYTDKDVLRGAEHDIIFSIDCNDAIEAGLTKEDAVELAKLNWSISEYDYFSCFV